MTAGTPTLNSKHDYLGVMSVTDTNGITGAAGSGYIYVEDTDAYQDYELGGYANLYDNKFCLTIVTSSYYFLPLAEHKYDSSKSDILDIAGIEGYESLVHDGSACKLFEETADYTPADHRTVWVLSVGYLPNILKMLPDGFLGMEDDCESPSSGQDAAKCGYEFGQKMNVWYQVTSIFIVVTMIFFGIRYDERQAGAQKASILGSSHYLMLAAFCGFMFLLEANALLSQNLMQDAVYHFIAAYSYGLIFAVLAGMTVIGLNSDRIRGTLTGEESSWKKAYAFFSTSFLITYPVLLAVLNFMGQPYHKDHLPTNVEVQTIFQLMRNDKLIWSILLGFLIPILTVAFVSAFDVARRTMAQTNSNLMIVKLFAHTLGSFLTCYTCRLTEKQLEGKYAERPTKTTTGKYLEMTQVSGQLKLT